MGITPRGGFAIAGCAKSAATEAEMPFLFPNNTLALYGHGINFSLPTRNPFSPLRVFSFSTKLVTRHGEIESAMFFSLNRPKEKPNMRYLPSKESAQRLQEALAQARPEHVSWLFCNYNNGRHGGATPNLIWQLLGSGDQSNAIKSVAMTRPGCEISTEQMALPWAQMPGHPKYGAAFFVKTPDGWRDLGRDVSNRFSSGDPILDRACEEHEMRQRGRDYFATFGDAMLGEELLPVERLLESRPMMRDTMHGLWEDLGEGQRGAGFAVMRQMAVERGPKFVANLLESRMRQDVLFIARYGKALPWVETYEKGAEFPTGDRAWLAPATYRCKDPESRQWHECGSTIPFNMHQAVTHGCENKPTKGQRAAHDVVLDAELKTYNTRTLPALQLQGRYVTAQELPTRASEALTRSVTPSQEQIDARNAHAREHGVLSSRGPEHSMLTARVPADAKSEAPRCMKLSGR